MGSLDNCVKRIECSLLLHNFIQRRCGKTDFASVLATTKREDQRLESRQPVPGPEASEGEDIKDKRGCDLPKRAQPSRKQMRDENYAVRDTIAQDLWDQYQEYRKEHPAVNGERRRTSAEFVVPQPECVRVEPSVYGAYTDLVRQNPPRPSHFYEMQQTK